MRKGDKKMHRLNSPEEFVGMAVEFVKLVAVGFKEDNLICHPIVPVVFLPKGLKHIPDEAIEDVHVYNILLYSKDGIEWEYAMDKMIEALEHGQNYYIADLNLDKFYEIKGTMVKDGILEFLNRKLNIVYSESMSWKNGFIGEIRTIPLDEYLRQIAF
jgi:hypothetical protein